MLSAALCHLSGVRKRIVVTGRPSAGCHPVDVSLIVTGPEAGWAELQFSVLAECEHSDCHITAEQFGKVCNNIENCGVNIYTTA